MGGGDEVEATIFFVRHGQSEGNRRMVMDGQTGGNFPLTDKGREQAERAGKRLAEEKFDLAYSSDLSRALDTARAIVRNNGSFGDESEIKQTELLRERHLGRFEGKSCHEYDVHAAGVLAEGGCGQTAEELLAEGGVFRKAWHLDMDGGGESVREVQERGKAFLRKVAEDSRAAGKGTPVRVLAASHGGFIKELIVHLVDDLGVDLVAVRGKEDPRKVFSPNTGVTVLKMKVSAEEDKSPQISCTLLHCAKHLD